MFSNLFIKDFSSYFKRENGITHILNLHNYRGHDESSFGPSLYSSQDFQIKHVPLSDFGTSVLSKILDECFQFIGKKKANFFLF